MHILNVLVEKIVVFEKVTDENGNKSQHIEICYKFIGYINMREMMKDGVICPVNTPEGPKYVKYKPCG